MIPGAIAIYMIPGAIAIYMIPGAIAIYMIPGAILSVFHHSQNSLVPQSSRQVGSAPAWLAIGSYVGVYTLYECLQNFCEWANFRG